MAKRKTRQTKKTKDMNRLIKVKEAAEILGVNPETLRRWDNKGKLKTKRHPMNQYRVYKLKEVLKLKGKIYE
jgi:DNA-binding transcriptional MerR regulator